MTWDRYGFIERDFDESGLPLGYVDDGKGGLVSNCFMCHGGKVGGRVVPGLGNGYLDLMTLTEDVEKLRAAEAVAAGKPPKKGSAGSFMLNHSKGLTNAFGVSVALGTIRDKEMNLIFPRNLGEHVDHDEDPPAWWSYAKKSRIYWTGFAHPTARTLMQFVTTQNNSGRDIKAYEPDFEHIQAYIKSLAAPKYPFGVDGGLAGKGEAVFNETCAKCHGRYGENGRYPNKVVAIEEVGTDPVRLTAIPKDWKAFYNTSWMTHYGKYPFELEPIGYLAPPLDGIWASGPYFHNGSVPTLWHVLHAAERPAVWRREGDGYDEERVGLAIEEMDEVPAGLSAAERRAHYDTGTVGHGNGGHLFPEELTEEQRRWVLEYLKSL
jgi:hypothetical protein